MNIIKTIGMVFLITSATGCFAYGCSWCNEAAVVAQREVGPAALLNKYMLLKEMHAQLEKKKADIQVYQSRIRSMDETYTGITRPKWAREDREQYNLWQTEVAGIKASYNDLAATYNAKMAEVNWRFANVGDLPQGATEPLPRNYSPYIEQ